MGGWGRGRGEGREGGKEWEPRGNKPERRESKEGGKEEGGGLESPKKKSGSRVSPWWRAVESLGRGFIGGPGQAGVSLSIRGERVCVWERLGDG